MSPFDRIAQLTAQLADAREQAARDSATIARLSHAKDVLGGVVATLEASDPADCSDESEWISGMRRMARQALAKTEGVTA